MKKTLVAKLALAGTVGLVAALASGTANATCAGCHTMHNSQNGSPMRYDGGATPLAILLRGTCYSCHTGTNSATDLAAGLAPKVYKPSGFSPSSTATMLAGGDFFWVGSTDSMGHNVTALSTAIAADGDLGNVPPGGGTAVALECAGTSGCHGLTSVADPLTSLNGAHHYPHNTIGDNLAATGVGNSYRFLYQIDGAEDTDWEFTVGATNHNYYQGASRSGAYEANTGTISELCARCHGSYHNVSNADQQHSDTFGVHESNNNFAAANTRWVRHPTDFDMATTGEFASYTTYQNATPVATTDVTAQPDVTAATDRIVMCLSCHRAHGSGFDDLLRFNYDLMDVGSSNSGGCFNCHADKN